MQLLTAARADELVRLKAIDIDTAGDVWSAELAEHKTAHHGRTRTIYFGPRAQRILTLFMRPTRPLDTPLFSPREANAEGKRRHAGGARRPHQKANARKTHRTVGEHYTTASYRRAIHRACKTAGVEQWGPHRLRHSAATALRREFGVELARLVLGHAHLNVTEIYAEADREKIVDAIRKIG